VNDSVKIDKVIKEIASEHGIVLSKDDPIMVLHNMNERLIKDGDIAQQKLLDDFRSEVEVIINQWMVNAKNNSDRILNASILASKAEITTVMQNQSDILIEKWQSELNIGFDELIKTIQSSRQSAILNIIASFITLISVGIALFVFLVI
jgi:hypothetical protein